MSIATTAPFLSHFLDPYDRQARTLPALLCLLPLLIVLVLVYPASINGQHTALALLVWCGAFFLLSRIARDAGKRIQDKLFASWRGAPSTQLLRHRDRQLDIHTKQALHMQLARLTGLTMPNAQEEDKDPGAADEVYRAASQWLIKRTRDSKRFSLLFKENVNFGFQRNALGLRWVGVTLALISILWILKAAGVLSLASPHYNAAHWVELPLPMGASLLVSLGMLAVWLFAITPAAAKRTGFAYAERLVECADCLTSDSPLE